MGIKEEESKPKIQQSIGDFYNSLQLKMIECNENDKLCYITSRSTKEIDSLIQIVCSDVLVNCKRFAIPTEGVFLRKTELSVNAFKYLICNTNFDSQSLLAEDTANGHLVDMQPPFSVYLLIEILWHCQFEDILAESILHFPLDVCLQILEVLPRCIDLLEFERATKFLTKIIPNAYKKIIILRDTGTQMEDVNDKAFAFSAHTVELILQFMNSRFLKFEDIPKEEQYKRHGTLLKSLIQMVRLCLTSKSKKVELPIEVEKLYKLTFGHAEYHKINDELLQKLLLGIDRELISLLLKKVKEVDCNIYINWTEYDDQENTAITLQRAIGLESYFFIENTKDLVSSELKDYKHLVECLGQIASKPDNSIESMQLEDLVHGVGEGKKECLVALFRRYKEWDDSVVDSVDSHVSLLTKSDCESIFEYLADELVTRSHPEKLQTCLLCLSKALVFLDITDLYEITIKFILKFGDDDNGENVIDLANFERFVALNPNLGISKNLRVVLFFLCLKPKVALKVLVKMAIGHADYPDVAVSIDDLMLLEPIMKIQTQSRHDTMIDALRHKCTEKLPYKTLMKFVCTPARDQRKPYSVSLVIRVLQDICLDGSEWNVTKFGSLLDALLTFCSPVEFVWEIFAPFLLSDRCTPYHLNYILLEIRKLEGKFSTEDADHRDAAAVLYDVLTKRGTWLLRTRDLSRYIVNDCVSVVEHLINWLVHGYLVEQSYPNNYYRLFLSTPTCNTAHTVDFNVGPATMVAVSYETNRLVYLVGTIIASYQGIAAKFILDRDYADPTRQFFRGETTIALHVDDVIRYMMCMCTKKQYLMYAEEMIKSTYVSFRNAAGPSKADRCDWIIRVTLEACLLCLEFPALAATDSVSFLLRCLQIFLKSMMNTKKKLNQSLCESLDKHLQIFKPIVPNTVVFEAFTELFNKFEEFKNVLAVRIQALEVFALSCTTNNENLKTYEGTNSPLGIKLYLAYDVVSVAMNEDSSCEEEYIRKLMEYFKPSEIES